MPFFKLPFARLILPALIVIVIVGGYLLYRFLPSGFNTGAPAGKEEVNFSTSVEKITAIGKLELVRYQLSDVVELTRESGSPIIPNSSVLLIIRGEATGCIDMTKIREENIEVKGDTATIELPAPEMCYFKIDHQKSKVYDTKFTELAQGSDLVGEAFKKAEKQIEQTALQSGILDQTKVNAQTVLKPMLETITKKKIILTFAPGGDTKINKK